MDPLFHTGAVRGATSKMETGLWSFPTYTVLNPPAVLLPAAIALMLGLVPDMLNIVSSGVVVVLCSPVVLSVM